MIGQVLATGSREDRGNIGALVAAGGSSSHRFVPGLAVSGASAAALADAIHLLCTLHGRYPGVMDGAAGCVAHPLARDWMTAAAAAFALERNYLTRLVVAVGPIPSTPGQAQSQAAVMAQANALDVLARSERIGTALGSALALALDWDALRPVLDRAARRFDVEPPLTRLPDTRETVAVAAMAGDTSAVARAIDFGARQLLIQHRGLWDLLEAREAARN